MWLLLSKLNKYYGINNRLKIIINDKLDNINNKIIQYQHQLEEYDSYVQLQNEYKILIAFKNNYDNIIKIHEFNETLKNLNYLIKSHQEVITVCNQKLIKLCLNRDILSEKINNFVTINHDIYVHELYVKCLSLSKKPGIPFHMMQQSLNILSKSINEILENVINFKMKFELNKNTVDVVQLKKIGNQIVKSSIWSGFEEVILDLAFRISVVKNHEYYPNILLIDEGFGTADSNNLSKLIDVLSQIGSVGMLKWMILISHVTDIHNISSNSLKINKKLGMSKLCNDDYTKYIPDYIQKMLK